MESIDLKSLKEDLQSLREEFANLKELTYEFGLLIKDMSDMDKRFENMTSVMQKQDMESVHKRLEQIEKKILSEIIEAKFDIIEENNK